MVQSITRLEEGSYEKEGDGNHLQGLAMVDQIVPLIETDQCKFLILCRTKGV